MNSRHLVLLLSLFLAPVALHAQSIVVGELGQPDAGGRGLPPAGTTFIDLNHPAAFNGTLTTATVSSIGEAPCATGFRLRFFRPLFNNIHMTLLAERGPFAMPASAGYVTLTLTPPVDVQRGDVIGVYLAADCGVVGISYGASTDALLATYTNYSGGTLPSDAYILRGQRLALRASTAPSALVGIVPAVGALTGSFGSRFRTTLQVNNPSGDAIKPQLVYHPAGQIASSSDPSITILLAPHATSAVEFSDAFNLTGLGTLDVLTAGQPPPLINARVYNDTPSGTNGFNEAMIPVTAALHNGEYANIIFPSDPANFRMNIGVRTLANGAGISVIAYDAASNVTQTINKSYSPNYFEQTSMQVFLGGVAPPANGSLVLQISNGGDAIIYVTTTDNRTNDSAITILRRR